MYLYIRANEFEFNVQLGLKVNRIMEDETHRGEGSSVDDFEWSLDGSFSQVPVLLRVVLLQGANEGRQVDVVVVVEVTKPSENGMKERH